MVVGMIEMRVPMMHAAWHDYGIHWHEHDRVEGGAHLHSGVHEAIRPGNINEAGVE